MLIIKFHRKRLTDTAQVPADTDYFAIDSQGRVAMKSLARSLPDPSAFTDEVVMLGLAPLTDRKLQYQFSEITPEFINSGIPGISSNTVSYPMYTIVVRDRGTKVCWSRGIEKMYFYTE